MLTRLIRSYRHWRLRVWERKLRYYDTLCESVHTTPMGSTVTHRAYVRRAVANAKVVYYTEPEVPQVRVLSSGKSQV